MALFFCGSAPLKAQQQWGYTQYVFNLFDINSAYAGNHQALSAAMRYRNQWTGFDGAPVSQALSLHSPLGTPAVAGGIRLIHESIGARNMVIAKTSVAYKLQLNEAKLSFAIGGGIQREQMNLDKLNAKDKNDEILAQGSWVRNVPIVEAALIYTSPRAYLGVECGPLNKPALQWHEASRDRLYRHYNIIGGWMKKFSDNDLLQFSALLRYIETGDMQAEGSVAILINDLLWFGAGYRQKFGALMYTECNITPRLRIGYSFDMALNALRGYQRGSHEFFLGYSLTKSHSPSIRYFK